ncbi:tetratricopeptide repeat protein, partial [Candidatus Parcubacteria bacterium]|nr:tetratricopeptide repeat protein [Candidatus Parcubacteria bacterium]
VFIQSMDAPTVVLSITSRGDYLMSQPFALLYYLSSFFLPVNLSADHGWVSALYVFDGWFILGIILLIFIIHLAVKFSKNIETRPISFGLLWFLIALLPSSSIFPLAEVVNDHRPFLAYIGLVLAIVWGFYLIFKNKKLAFLKPSKTTIIFLASAILVTSALGTYNRNKVWHTSESLWYDVVQKNPQHARGLMNYALSQMQKGRLETAQYYLEKAAPLAPLYPYLKINLAIVKEYLGNPQDAETYFKQALILGPNHQETLYCYADFLNRQGRKPEAIKMLYRLLKTSPSYLKTYYLLMDIYSHQHDIIHLSEIAEKILKIIPNDPTTLQYLAKTQDLNVELEKARIQVEENPTVENLFYFGFLNIQAKNFEQAIELNKQVIELEPNYIQAYNNLGTCYNHLGKWKQAIETFQKALAIDPNYNLVQDNLNYALEQQKLTKSE